MYSLTTKLNKAHSEWTDLQILLRYQAACRLFLTSRRLNTTVEGFVCEEKIRQAFDDWVGIDWYITRKKTTPDSTQLRLMTDELVMCPSTSLKRGSED